MLACLLVAGCRLHFDEQPRASDARVESMLDANIDAMNDAANILTITFGERPTSTRQGVTRDTFLDETRQTDNWGGEDNVSVSGDSGFTSHAVLHFDLSSIAPQTRVTRAELELAIVNFGDQVTGDIAVYEVAEPWTEGTQIGTAGAGATWLARDTAMTWSTAGGTRGGKLAGPLLPADPVVIAIPLATVQRWIDQPATNLGVLVVPDAPTSSVHYHFESRDNISSDKRPQLTVDVEP